MPSHEELDALYQALKDVAMNPEFQSVVAEIQNLPASGRSHAVTTRLTPEALAARGIQIPKGFTITTQASPHSFVANAINDPSAINGLESVICIFNPLNGQRVCLGI